MSGRYVLNEAGEPQLEPDVIKWEVWYESADTEVCQDRFEFEGQEILVITVFLGLDLSFGVGAPLLYETIVDGREEDCERYATRDEAVAGHERVVKEVKEELEVQSTFAKSLRQAIDDLTDREVTRCFEPFEQLSTRDTNIQLLNSLNKTLELLLTQKQPLSSKDAPLTLHEEVEESVLDCIQLVCTNYGKINETKKEPNDV